MAVNLVGVPRLVLSFDVDLPEFYITIVTGCGQDSAIMWQGSLAAALHKSRVHIEQKAVMYHTPLLSEDESIQKANKEED